MSQVIICKIDTATGDIYLGDKVVGSCNLSHCTLRGFLLDADGNITSAGIVDHTASSVPGVTLDSVSYLSSSGKTDEEQLKLELHRLESLAAIIKEKLNK